jgi:hypothetical protein
MARELIEVSQADPLRLTIAALTNRARCITCVDLAFGAPGFAKRNMAWPLQCEQMDKIWTFIIVTSFFIESIIAHLDVR